jgi:hypothetical protein
MQGAEKATTAANDQRHKEEQAGAPPLGRDGGMTGGDGLDSDHVLEKS